MILFMAATYHEIVKFHRKNSKISKNHKKVVKCNVVIKNHYFKVAFSIYSQCAKFNFVCYEMYCWDYSLISYLGLPVLAITFLWQLLVSLPFTLKACCSIFHNFTLILSLHRHRYFLQKVGHHGSLWYWKNYVELNFYLKVIIPCLLKRLW